ncbi:MAG: RluA family pseudouridine synthase [Candidatus Viridilinea halotolerans]|uniref:RNA pseudouridylate synthase n=1 Tax=Candidatus Viridilinea halotolerans TaxID=2491704 RepID=A0A426TXG0_9CHLR|nr:MAG: RluA family pseudouridine synthase [Candidatus Viridilinea halotolerans]
MHPIPQQLTFTIPPHLAGAPVHAAAAELAADLGQTVVARGGAWLDGRRVVDAATPVAAGAILVLRLPPNGCYNEIELCAADLIFEDAWLMVLHKAASCYVSATPWDVCGNLLAALQRFLLARDGSAPPLHLAHRLDRDTSGLLLVSKHPAANAPLQHAFAHGQVAKRYTCLCAGVPTWEQMELQTGHGRGARGLWRLYPLAEVGQALPMGGGRVRLAHTSFELEAAWGDHARVRATLHTGRTHQIRLHMASLGLPLLGDVRYGGPSEHNGQLLSRHMLHATELRLAHPVTGEPLAWCLPAPWE